MYSLSIETSNGVSPRAVVAITASVVPLAVITIVFLVLIILLLVYMRHKQANQKDKHYMTEVSIIVFENDGKDKEIETTEEL